MPSFRSERRKISPMVHVVAAAALVALMTGDAAAGLLRGCPIAVGALGDTHDAAVGMSNPCALRVPDVLSLDAVAIPAAAGIPALCRVSGVLAPDTAFEVSLPECWNGRFSMIGNGVPGARAAAAELR